MKSFRLLSDGRLVEGAGDLDVVNPASGAVFARSPRANLATADRTIAAAKRAFRSWAHAHNGIDPVALQRPERYQVRAFAKLSSIADFEEFYASIEPELRAKYREPLEQGPLQSSCCLEGCGLEV